MAHLISRCDQEEVKLRVFPLVLKGEARTWYEVLSNNIKEDWETLQQAFLNHFSSKEEVGDIWQQLQSLHQDSTSGYAAYESWLNQLWSKFVTLSDQPVPDFLKKETFVRGLFSELQEKVECRFSKSFEEALHLARIKEKKLRYHAQKSRGDNDQLSTQVTGCGRSYEVWDNSYLSCFPKHSYSTCKSIRKLPNTVSQSTPAQVASTLESREQTSKVSSLKEVTTKETTTLKVLEESSNKGDDGPTDRQQSITFEGKEYVSFVELKEQMVTLQPILSKDINKPSHQREGEGLLPYVRDSESLIHPHLSQSLDLSKEGNTTYATNQQVYDSFVEIGPLIPIKSEALDDGVVASELGNVCDLESFGISTQSDIVKGRECDLNLMVVESIEEVGSLNLVVDSMQYEPQSCLDRKEHLLLMEEGGCNKSLPKGDSIAVEETFSMGDKEASLDKNQGEGFIICIKEVESLSTYDYEQNSSDDAWHKLYGKEKSCSIMDLEMHDMGEQLNQNDMLLVENRARNDIYDSFEYKSRELMYNVVMTMLLDHYARQVVWLSYAYLDCYGKFICDYVQRSHKSMPKVDLTLHIMFPSTMDELQACRVDSYVLSKLQDQAIPTTIEEKIIKTKNDPLRDIYKGTTKRRYQEPISIWHVAWRSMMVLAKGLMRAKQMEDFSMVNRIKVIQFSRWQQMFETLIAWSNSFY